MKTRTIQDLHDKCYGHKKFAQVCDSLVERGYCVTDIKEYNEFFKFKLDGYLYSYSKYWKSSVNEYVNYIIDLYNRQKILEGYRLL